MHATNRLHAAAACAMLPRPRKGRLVDCIDARCPCSPHHELTSIARARRLRENKLQF
jgi:hypothetical protein